MSPSSANYEQLRTAMDRPRPEIPLAVGGVEGGGHHRNDKPPLSFEPQRIASSGKTRSQEVPGQAAACQPEGCLPEGCQSTPRAQSCPGRWSENRLECAIWYTGGEKYKKGNFQTPPEMGSNLYFESICFIISELGLK